jgi:hypothetical protein
MKIFENPLLAKTVLKRMCRSKKKRIRKKWLKNSRNYRLVPDTSCYIFKDYVICHPAVAAKLRQFGGACDFPSPSPAFSLDLEPKWPAVPEWKVQTSWGFGFPAIPANVVNICTT